MKSFFTIIFCVFSVLLLNAQEVLIDIVPSELFGGKYLNSNSLKSTHEADTLSLPFFDDFANAKVYPYSGYWLDKAAFINNTYAYNPLSIGVASLDALDSVGAVYTNLSWQVSEVADYLTSKPINLSYEPADSIYLSFYYQCGGLGEAPEENDSLVVQFATPDSAWHSVWNTPGALQADTFFRAMIPIRDPYLLKDGFQFRFKNYVSLSSNYELAYKSNSDVWNIDYVYIDTARNINDTIVEDVAFISNFRSLIKDFESVPWEHFKPVAESNTLDTLSFIYKNNGTNVQNINRQLVITNVYQGGISFSSLDDNENIEPFSVLEYNKILSNFEFDTNGEDSARFKIRGFIKTDTTSVRRPYRWNDTIEYYQNFHNYYAYDDGSSERGYGISGQGTTGAALAYSFTPLQADTLRGVNIFFNQVMDEHNINYFFLTAWDDNEGVPGDTLIQQIGVRPIYSDSINEFCYYEFDRAIYIEDKFYIGWIKTTDDLLNVGYDVNRNAGEKVFYNTEGTWQQSMYSGAPMIRPVFGKKELAISSPEYTFETEIDLYPNPVNDLLYVIISDVHNFDYKILDLNGRIIESGNSSGSISFSNLQEGMYFLRIEFENNCITRKVLVNR